ncbi:MAG: hypothetical protein H7239_12680 [Flavobacterium sp.]|nr:hypothetical protein [Flavobacterium sp.]
MLKNNISFVYLFFFLLISCNDNNGVFETDLHKMKLHGNIKKIDKTSYYVKLYFGGLVKAKRCLFAIDEPFHDDIFQILYFNQKGNITNRLYSDLNNHITGETKYFYDNDNRIIKKNDGNIVRNITYDLKNNKYVEIKKYPWDEKTINYIDKNNNIIKIDMFEKNILIQRSCMIYNSDDKKISEKIYGTANKGELSYDYIYKYDNKNNLISESNKLDIKNEQNYNYNENGDVIEWCYSNSPLRELLFGTYTYKYDEKGNWIERIYYLGKGKYKKVEILTKRIIEYY